MERYTKGKLLGKGGFGSAWLVTANDQTRKQFVLKEIQLGMDRKVAEDAKKEAAFLRQLEHPNIVSYTESFQVPSPGGGTMLCIVMEYADGGDLAQRVAAAKKRGAAPISESEALNYFLQICLALKHVHSKRILHRDLKTQNVFLTKSGIVKVGDFGIAKALTSTADMAKTQIGTPYYLSPEICCDKPYNRKSDMWALGVILYEMLALALPFTAPNLPQLVTKILAGVIPPLPPRYSPQCRQLVESLLKRDPRERPTVGTVLRTDLMRGLMEQLHLQTLTGREFGQALKLVAQPQLPAAPAHAHPSAVGGGGAGAMPLQQPRAELPSAQPKQPAKPDVASAAAAAAVPPALQGAAKPREGEKRFSSPPPAAPHPPSSRSAAAAPVAGVLLNIAVAARAGPGLVGEVAAGAVGGVASLAAAAQARQQQAFRGRTPSPAGGAGAAAGGAAPAAAAAGHIVLNPAPVFKVVLPGVASPPPQPFAAGAAAGRAGGVGAAASAAASASALGAAAAAEREAELKKLVALEREKQRERERRGAEAMREEMARRKAAAAEQAAKDKKREAEAGKKQMEMFQEARRREWMAAAASAAPCVGGEEGAARAAPSASKAPQQAMIGVGDPVLQLPQSVFAQQQQQQQKLHIQRQQHQQTNLQQQQQEQQAHRQQQQQAFQQQQQQLFQHQQLQLQLQKEQQQRLRQHQEQQAQLQALDYEAQLEAIRKEAHADRLSARRRAQAEKEAGGLVSFPAASSTPAAGGGGSSSSSGGGGSGGGDGEEGEQQQHSSGGNGGDAESVRAAARHKKETEAAMHDAALREASRIAHEERRALEEKAKGLGLLTARQHGSGGGPLLVVAPAQGGGGGVGAAASPSPSAALGEPTLLPPRRAAAGAAPAGALSGEGAPATAASGATPPVPSGAAVGHHLAYRDTGTAGLEGDITVDPGCNGLSTDFMPTQVLAVGPDGRPLGPLQLIALQRASAKGSVSSSGSGKKGAPGSAAAPGTPSSSFCGSPLQQHPATPTSASKKGLQHASPSPSHGAAPSSSSSSSSSSGGGGGAYPTHGRRSRGGSFSRAEEIAAVSALPDMPRSRSGSGVTSDAPSALATGGGGEHTPTQGGAGSGSRQRSPALGSAGTPSSMPPPLWQHPHLQLQPGGHRSHPQQHSPDLEALRLPPRRQPHEGAQESARRAAEIQRSLEGVEDVLKPILQRPLRRVSMSEDSLGGAAGGSRRASGVSLGLPVAGGEVDALSEFAGLALGGVVTVGERHWGGSAGEEAATAAHHSALSEEDARAVAVEVDIEGMREHLEEALRSVEEGGEEEEEEEEGEEGEEGEEDAVREGGGGTHEGGRMSLQQVIAALAQADAAGFGLNAEEDLQQDSDEGGEVEASQAEASPPSLESGHWEDDGEQETARDFMELSID